MRGRDIDVGAEGSVAVADGHRSLKDWCQRLAGVELSFLLTRTEDWRQAFIGLFRGRLHFGEGWAERELTFGFERRASL